MFSFAVSIDIEAPPARVWRALCDPAEVVRWDANVERALDGPPDYPQPGQHVRWRFRTGPFRTLHDRPQEVAPERMLRSLLQLGPAQMDETYTLEPAGDGTRLMAAMHVRLRWPIVGGVAAQRYFGPAAQSAMTASLAAIKRHCEAG